VEIDVILPSRGNLPDVTSAARANLWQVREGGGRVGLQPEPLDRTKLLYVKDTCFRLDRPGRTRGACASILI